MDEITDEDLERLAQNETVQALTRNIIERHEELWDAHREIERYVGLSFRADDVKHVLASGPPETVSEEQVRSLIRSAFDRKAVLDETGIVFEDTEE